MSTTPHDPTTGVPPGVPANMIVPTGNMPAIGVPNSQDYARLIYAAPYFTTVPIAEIIQPSVTEAVENALPSLIPPYVDNAVLAGIQQYAVLLTGSTMSGPLFLNPLMPTADSQAATKAYVDTMLATAGIPEVPPVPVGQVWARETGQWVPISQAEGTFLPISGGSMQGNINMSGNTLTNMAAVPAMPNGAAPAQWVLNQIASVSLYQGTWDADTNVPDLTQLSVRVNGYTWIAITTSPSGVVIGAAIPGLQGLTIYNGDTVIYSTAQGTFSAIHAGGLSLPEADARYVQLAGSQMSGALLLNANASQPMQATTLQQLEAAVANTVTPDAPADGQAYLRLGVGTTRWVPGLPLAGGILTGALTLSGPGASGNNAVTVAQMNSAISGAGAGFLPIAGGTMTGPLVLSGNAAANLNAVPLQQLNATLNTYAPLQSPVFTGTPNLPTGTVGVTQAAATSNTTLSTTAFVHSVTGSYLPLAGGTLTGTLTGTSISLSSGLTISGTSGVSAPGGTVNAANLTSNTATLGGVVMSGGGLLACTSMAWPSNAAAQPQSNDNVSLGVGGAAWFQVYSYNFPNASDPRSKKHIAAVPESALASVLSIPVHNFHYLSQADDAPLHWGFMSTHVHDTMGDNFAGWIKSEGGEQEEALNIMDMIGVLWAAVQELAKRGGA